MKKSLMLFKLQIKAAFGSVGKIILGTLGLTVLVALVSVGINMASQSGDREERMIVAIVYPQDDDNTYIKMAFNMISNMDTVSEVCAFEQTDKDTAYRGLKDGKYTAAVIIPKGFIDDIMVGINTPAEVVYSKKGVNNTSMLFREMLNAGASDLSSAEAGVYSLDDIFNTLLKNKKKYMTDAENELNEIYFTYALNRSIYFKVTDLSEKEGLSTIQYYTCTAIILLLMLSGITCADLLKRDNNAISTALKREGIHAGTLGVAKTLGVTLVFMCIGTVIMVVSILVSSLVPSFASVIGISNPLEFLTSFLQMFVLIYSVFAFTYCIFRLVGNPVYAVLILFLVGMCEMFASGCFVTSALLPKPIRMVGDILPASWYFRLTGQIIKGGFSAAIVFVNLLYDVIFIGIASLAEKFQRNN